MKQIFCKKGQFTKIINNFGRGYPQTFDITIISEDNKKVSGEYIEKRYTWIFPKEPVKGGLEKNMKFERYWINGIYSVSIKPQSDVVVSLN